jgi:hypothetical protein
MNSEAELYRTGAIIDLVLTKVGMEALSENVSERTGRTREIGAFMCLELLAEGEWCVAGLGYAGRREQLSDELGELLSRVIHNAVRQGINPYIQK